MPTSAPDDFDIPLPLGPGVRILARHATGLVALEKPVGIRSHPNDAEADPHALLVAPYDESVQAFDLPHGGEAHLIHRLDAATSGVILLALNADLAEAARQGFADRTVEKTYQALVFGVPRQRRAQWEDRLRIRRQNGHQRAEPAADGAPALCAMRSLRPIPGTPIMTRLELHPQTGRTHQLRIQCSLRQLPIVGDAVYGDFQRNRQLQRATGRDRLYLHAERLKVRLRWRGQPIQFEAHSPLPAEFEHPRSKV
ncbi:MAG: RNA pseudouridine synthase [Verrucomicrobiales bacterium]|nr:RNA pseudouridine synthase [Verrucomicrobiales bacterium]